MQNKNILTGFLQKYNEQQHQFVLASHCFQVSKLHLFDNYLLWKIELKKLLLGLKKAVNSLQILWKCNQLVLFECLNFRWHQQVGNIQCRFHPLQLSEYEIFCFLYFFQKWIFQLHDFYSDCIKILLHHLV